jgi:hypothetical protein
VWDGLPVHRYFCCQDVQLAKKGNPEKVSTELTRDDPNAPPDPNAKKTRKGKPRMERYPCKSYVAIKVNLARGTAQTTINHLVRHELPVNRSVPLVVRRFIRRNLDMRPKALAEFIEQNWRGKDECPSKEALKFWWRKYFHWRCQYNATTPASDTVMGIFGRTEGVENVPLNALCRGAFLHTTACIVTSIIDKIGPANIAEMAMDGTRKHNVLCAHADQ